VPDLRQGGHAEDLGWIRARVQGERLLHHGLRQGRQGPAEKPAADTKSEPAKADAKPAAKSEAKAESKPAKKAASE
jgi:hypothetical protein